MGATAPRKDQDQMTVEASTKIRAALKAAGYGTKDVSVKNDSYSMGSSVHVRIKRATVPKDAIEAIANKHESVRRDDSGEILSGGNMFVSVDYAHGALDEYTAIAEVQLAAGRFEFGSFSLSNDSSYPHLRSVWKRDADGSGSHAGSVQREHVADGLVRILAAAGELPCLDAGCVAFSNAAGELVTCGKAAAAPAPAAKPKHTVSTAFDVYERIEARTAEPAAASEQVELLARMNDAAANIEPEPALAGPAAPYVPVYPKRAYGSTDEVEVGDMVRMNHRDHDGNPIESPGFDDCVIAAIDGGVVTLHRPYMLARGGVPLVQINVFSCELGLLVERFSVLTTGHAGFKSQL